MGNSIFFRGVAGTLFALAAATAFAKDDVTEAALFGPAFGSNRYAASIASSTSEPDVDDYVSSLLAGERLTVTVAAPRSSALAPRLALVGPDGAVTTPTEITSRSAGKVLSLKNFAVPTTGRWAVRISGAQGSEGAYSVAFKIAAAKSVRRNVAVSAAPGSTALAFDGLDGASLDLLLTWKKGSARVTLGSIESPGHSALPGVSPRVGRNSAALQRFALKGGDGAFTLRLSSMGAATACSVTLRVTPQGRPSVKRTIALSDAEPWLDPQGTPIAGVAGTSVRLTGGNFSTVDPPTVFFGRVPASASVVGGGTALDVVPPEFVDGVAVGVSVVAKDGQAVSRNGYFRYVEGASIDDLVDDNDRPVRAGRALGGDVLVLRGAGLTAARSVRFGDVPATIVDAASPTRMRIVVPASSGDATVYLVDAYGRTVRSSFAYEFVAPPTLGPAPYAPAFGAVAGGTVVTLSGAGFRPSDRLEIDGVSVPFTWTDGTRIQFVSPQKPAGSYSVVIFDSFDEAAVAPQFQVKAPPAVASVSTINSGLLGPTDIDCLGGTMVQIDGSNFQAGVVVTIGGVQALVVSVSGTSLTIIAPAGSAGAADLVVTDAAGQAVTVSSAFMFV